MISPELAQELKTILEEDYNILITIEDATILGSSWVEYFDLLRAPLSTSSEGNNE